MRRRALPGIRLAVAVAAVLVAPHPTLRADSAANPDAVATLQRVIEEQNRRLEALTLKVLELERRLATDTDAATNATTPRLPTIVIDTHGVPVATNHDRGGSGLGNRESGESALPTSPSPLPAPATSPATNSARAAVPGSARIDVGPSGFSLSSADGDHVLRLRGLLQVDTRTYLGDSSLDRSNDGLLLRRARPILEGTLYRDVDFLILPDFAGTSPQLFDATVNYRFRPELQLRAGKFKSPVGLEQLQLDAHGLFNERSPVSTLVPTRNVGVQLWGETPDGFVSYAAGVFGTTGDGRNPGASAPTEDPEFAGRLFLQPFANGSVPSLRRLGFGVGGSFSQVHSNAAAMPGTTGGSLPGYTTVGGQQFFAYDPAAGQVVGDGVHWRISPQAAWYSGPFGLLAEYLVSEQGVLNSLTLREAELQHGAWQIAGQWVVTGEPASGAAIVPEHPFHPGHGGWGAWQLAARYGGMHLDPDTFHGFSNPAYSAGSADFWSVGINWWLNRNLRILTSYSQTVFHGGGADPNLFDPATARPPASVTSQDERVIMTRMQLGF